MKKLLMLAVMLTISYGASAQRKTEIVETTVNTVKEQALDILSAKLASSGKFLLLERSDLATLLEECQKNGGGSSTIGADYMIIGSITEYGRKNTGKNGVFTSQKTQTVEAAVSIRLVDVSTGLIIYSDEAKGSAELTTKTTMGVGGQASYDATLSDKAISEAINQLVENIINKCTNSPWKQSGNQDWNGFQCEDTG